MTNYEHHKDWFETNKFKLISSDGYAVDTETHKTEFCAGKNCDECIFGEVVGSCHEARVEWLSAEYVEQKEEADEE